MPAPQTLNLTKSLATDPRASLESWLEDIETHARNLCAEHDVTGALTLVAADDVWKIIPANLTNAAGVAQGDPPQYRARPTWDQPIPHANNAVAAAVSLYKLEAARYADYSRVSSALTTALLVSIGDKNTDHLKTTFPLLGTYMLSPRDIVDTMRAKHGVATSDDVSKLRDPLSRPLTSLSDLTGHIAWIPSCWPASI
jgi:hypothetical protein